MVEIYSKSLVKAIDKVLRMKLSYNTYKGDEKLPLFGNLCFGGQHQ